MLKTNTYTITTVVAFSYIKKIKQKDLISISGFSSLKIFFIL